MLTRMARFLTRMARMARTLTRMTRWLAGSLARILYTLAKRNVIDRENKCEKTIFDVLYSKQAFLNNENIGFKNPQN